MNYNTLVLQIQDSANRSDAKFLAEIPNFIDQTFRRIYADIKNIGSEITIAGNLIIGTNTIAKPANWLQPISFRITDTRNGSNLNSFLFLRTKEFCQAYWPNPILQDSPMFYADSLAYTNIYLSPTPDFAYPFQWVFLGIPLFDAQNSTNFVTDRYPDLLFNGCMKRAMYYLRNDERVMPYQAAYDDALQSAKQDSVNRKNDNTTKIGKE